MMEIALITVIIAITLGFLYYNQNRKTKKGVDEMINQVEQMSNAEYEELVKETQIKLEKTKFKNVVTKEVFSYFGQGRFIQSIANIDQVKYIDIQVNQEYMVEFYTHPSYSIAGRYNNDYYIKYFDKKPYVSLLLLQTLYLFDESLWRKILYPIEYIDGLGYNFTEFLKLSLPERHPDDKWLEETSSGSSNRFYFKDLTVAEILFHSGG